MKHREEGLEGLYSIPETAFEFVSIDNATDTPKEPVTPHGIAGERLPVVESSVITIP